MWSNRHIRSTDAEAKADLEIQRCSFILRKRKSKAPELREEETSTAKEECIQCEAQIGKVMDVSWNQTTDLMGVSSKKGSTLEHETTHRGILMTVAAIYDPLGVVSPLIILAKIIYHDDCKSKMTRMQGSLKNYSKSRRSG